MITPGSILRDDEMRQVRVLEVFRDADGHKVRLERLDRQPREHRLVVRWQAEVAHYPTWQES